MRKLQDVSDSLYYKQEILIYSSLEEPLQIGGISSSDAQDDGNDNQRRLCVWRNPRHTLPPIRVDEKNGQGNFRKRNRSATRLKPKKGSRLRRAEVPKEMGIKKGASPCSRVHTVVVGSPYEQFQEETSGLNNKIQPPCIQHCMVSEREHPRAYDEEEKNIMKPWIGFMGKPRLHQGSRFSSYPQGLCDEGTYTIFDRKISMWYSENKKAMEGITSIFKTNHGWTLSIYEYGIPRRSTQERILVRKSKGM